MPDLTKLAQNTPRIQMPNLEELNSSKMAEMLRRTDPAIKAGEMTVEAMAKLQNLMTGVATFNALRGAVAQLLEAAPADHDVLIRAFNILVTNVSFARPHTLLLGGRDEEGNKTIVVAH